MTDKQDAIALKWGTLKAWSVNSEAGEAALRAYMDAGPQSMSAMSQRDTPEQKLALCALIDAADLDTVFLDWDGKDVSKDEAKRYVMEYGS